MSQSYVLPDSRVYLMIKIDNNMWEVWDGFRISLSEEIQVSNIGIVSADAVKIKYSDRTNFQRVVLKASTVVSLTIYLLKSLNTIIIQIFI